ncbi:hypothetical protein [Sinosporangium siamense]|uniref:Uncharacterized protein n=1 Tax=Sinosporangium siamense TaxID=1367973 RepID=A0A919RKY1_9ACTN|nr:hypothetical protein [Sinosporangium siamense]GII95722.1 hypothetical protein Ssi02_59530 [Sinosporangium siamense]
MAEEHADRSKARLRPPYGRPVSKEDDIWRAWDTWQDDDEEPPPPPGERPRAKPKLLPLVAVSGVVAVIVFGVWLGWPDPEAGRVASPVASPTTSAAFAPVPADPSPVIDTPPPPPGMEAPTADEPLATKPVATPPGPPPPAATRPAVRPTRKPPVVKRAPATPRPTRATRPTATPRPKTRRPTGYPGTGPTVAPPPPSPYGNDHGTGPTEPPPPPGGR